MGTEHIDDIIADFAQSFAAAKAATTGGAEENAGEAGSAGATATLVV